jgi:hypothetical protein
MLLNFILFLISLTLIFLLVKQIKKPNINQYIKPNCNFTISKPKFEINNDVRVVKFNVLSKNKNRYFIDFPVAFRFFSNQKFRAKIKITYTVPGDEVELVYDKIIEFEDIMKEHIYYINDIIIGVINIEIYTHTNYGRPTIGFEILKNDLCQLSKEYKLIINFPK